MKALLIFYILKGFMFLSDFKLKKFSVSMNLLHISFGAVRKRDIAVRVI